MVGRWGGRYSSRRATRADGDWLADVLAAISSLFTHPLLHSGQTQVIFGPRKTMTCPSAWTPAPADAAVPFSSACYKASGYAISLRECVER